MRGLLYKDCITIFSSYKKNAILVLIVYGLMAFAMNMPFMLYAMVFLTGLYALSCLSFDEASHWDVYARTLPLSKGQLVGCKYLLGLIWMGIGCAVAMVMLLAMYLVVPTAPAPLEALCGCLSSLSVVLLYYAVSFPLSYKFGSTKARSNVLLVMAGLGALAFFAARYLKAPVGFLSTLNSLTNLQGTLLIVGFAAVALGCYALSWVVSTCIYNKKEY